MRKQIPLTVFVVLFLSFSVSGQEKHCTSQEEPEMDLNAISVTKCAVVEQWKGSKDKKDLKKTRQLAVKLSVRRRRVVRDKKEASSVNLSSNKLSKIASSKASVSNLVKLETEIDDSVIMPFSIVSEKPNFFDCKTNDVDCFKENVNKHIKKHFSYPREAYEKKLEGKVIVRFNINKYGRVDNVKGDAKYENEILKNEAIRIVSELPLFSPAKQNDKLVNTSYGVTINFKINDNVRKQFGKEIKNAISFDKVSEIPLFKSCDDGSKEENLKCFNINMVEHIKDNFSYPKMAAEQNIQGKVWVTFVIDNRGQVRDIKMNGSEDSYSLKTEARRLVQMLPNFKPGKLNGKRVHTRYVLPINFTLD